MRHMSLQQLSALRDAALAGISLEIVRNHVTQCEECRARHARLERVDGLLVQIISHDPGVVWFEDASFEIGRLIRGEGDGRVAGPIRPGGTPRASGESESTPALGQDPAPREVPTPRAVPARREAPPPRSMLTGSRIELQRWGIHAERIARARRDAGGRHKETVLPLVTGLIGGAAAGALMVAMVIAPRLSPARHPNALPANTKVASPAREPLMATSVAAAVTPENRPVVVALRPPRAPAEPAPVVRPRAAAVAAPAPALVPPAPRRVTSPPSPVAASPSPVASSRPAATHADEAEWPLFCGVVTDEMGSPIVGASVLLADLDIQAHTDRRGRFCVAAPPGSRTLTVIAQGFAPQRRVVSVAAGVSELSLSLKAAP